MPASTAKMLLRIFAIELCFVGISGASTAAALSVKPLCPKGTFLNSKTGLCDPCPSKTYTDQPNRLEYCRPCPECTGGRSEVSECTKSSAPVCECPKGYYDYGGGCRPVTASIVEAYCVQRQNPSDGYADSTLRSLGNTINDAVRVMATQNCNNASVINQQIIYHTTSNCNSTEENVKELKRLLNDTADEVKRLRTEQLSNFAKYISLAFVLNVLIFELIILLHLCGVVKLNERRTGIKKWRSATDSQRKPAPGSTEPQGLSECFLVDLTTEGAGSVDKSVSPPATPADKTAEGRASGVGQQGGTTIPAKVALCKAQTQNPADKASRPLSVVSEPGTLLNQTTQAGDSTPSSSEAIFVEESGETEPLISHMPAAVGSTDYQGSTDKDVRTTDSTKATHTRQPPAAQNA